MIKKDEKSWATDILSTRRIWQQILKKSIDDLKKVALYFSELNYNSIKHYHLHLEWFWGYEKKYRKGKDGKYQASRKNWGIVKVRILNELFTYNFTIL